MTIRIFFLKTEKKHNMGTDKAVVINYQTVIVAHLWPYILCYNKITHKS